MYQEPVYSRIPGGLNARQVDLDYINGDRKFREAILKPTTTFFEPNNGVFACTVEDKRKLVAWLREPGNRYSNLIIFWPGKYQSHAFCVLRHHGAVTRIQELLNEVVVGQSDRMEALRQIRKMRAELNALQTKINKDSNPYWLQKARDSYPYDDWNL